MIVQTFSFSSVFGTLHMCFFLGCYGEALDYPHKAREQLCTELELG
jgi:hypothetical protein